MSLKRGIILTVTTYATADSILLTTTGNHIFMITSNCRAKHTYTQYEVNTNKNHLNALLHTCSSHVTTSLRNKVHSLVLQL